ncbi:hypothetical protein SADUNF_Sadunf14G0135000 [Salix dunnii]|uniref:Uncharacterized protein n=1 Tax=Salix dunnii TaxID=1413687 RepID=A0A835JFI7_9ROSI|nr:hypothetical protein SADUNF_Sadunf14G0135000 [Salix dunnii]
MSIDKHLDSIDSRREGSNQTCPPASDEDDGDNCCRQGGLDHREREKGSGKEQICLSNARPQSPQPISCHQMDKLLLSRCYEVFLCAMKGNTVLRVPWFLGLSGERRNWKASKSYLNSAHCGQKKKEEKRKQILAAARGAVAYIKHGASLVPNCTIPNFSHILTSSPSVQVGKDSLTTMERAAERECMVLDIKAKLHLVMGVVTAVLSGCKTKVLHGLLLRLLKLGATGDPFSSFEYGTILVILLQGDKRRTDTFRRIFYAFQFSISFALALSDEEGIGGGGFVECIREHDRVLNILMIVFPQTSGQKKKEEKRKQILAAARGAVAYIKHGASLVPNCTIPNFSHILTSSPSVQVGKDSLTTMERAAERECMVLDIKAKLHLVMGVVTAVLSGCKTKVLHGLLLRLLKLGATGDPFSSFEYGTILVILLQGDKRRTDTFRRIFYAFQFSISFALALSDEEGIGGGGFVECIREHDRVLNILMIVFPQTSGQKKKEEKRKQILAAARGAVAYIKHGASLVPNCTIPNFSHILTSSPSVQVGKDSLTTMERAAERECMVLDIKAKLHLVMGVVTAVLSGCKTKVLHGLLLRLLKLGATGDPFSSFEYGTILVILLQGDKRRTDTFRRIFYAFQFSISFALALSDEEGIGGGGFVECIREHDRVLNILMIVFPQTSGQKKKEEKRKQILAAARGAVAYIKHGASLVPNCTIPNFSHILTSSPSVQVGKDSLTTMERAAERECMVLDIKAKLHLVMGVVTAVLSGCKTKVLHGLLLRLLKLGATGDPFSSFEYGTILVILLQGDKRRTDTFRRIFYAFQFSISFALALSDEEGIGGGGFVECIREHDRVLNILMIVFPQTSGQKKKEEKRKQILAAARGAVAYIKHGASLVPNCTIPNFSHILTSSPSVQVGKDSLTTMERAAERECMVLDIKAKLHLVMGVVTAVLSGCKTKVLHGLLLRLLKLGATGDPFSSFEYGTILVILLQGDKRRTDTFRRIFYAFQFSISFALALSDEEGIGGGGFVECIREHDRVLNILMIVFPQTSGQKKKEEKRKQILAAARGAVAYIKHGASLVPNCTIPNFSHILTSSPSVQVGKDSLTTMERAAERECMVLDIKAKLHLVMGVVTAVLSGCKTKVLHGLLLRLLKLGATGDPFSSFEYGTILVILLQGDKRRTDTFRRIFYAFQFSISFALALSDEEGIGGGGFVECIREHDRVLNILMIVFPQTSGQKKKEEKRKQILAAARGAVAYIKHGASLVPNCTIPNFSHILTSSPSVQVGKDSLTTMERAAERECMVLDIKAKLHLVMGVVTAVLSGCKTKVLHIRILNQLILCALELNIIIHRIKPN